MLDNLFSFISFFSNDYNLDEIGKKKYYVISLILLIETLLLCSDWWFRISNKLEKILGVKNIIYIVSILEIVFLCLICFAIIAGGILIISLILYCIFTKIGKKKNWSEDMSTRVEHLLRVSYGSKFRFKETLEWLIIIFIPLYKWDSSFVMELFGYMSNWLKIVLVITAVIVIASSSIRGIINRFFCLNGYENSETKKELKNDIKLESLLRKSLELNEKLIIEMQELIKQLRNK